MFFIQEDPWLLDQALVSLPGVQQAVGVEQVADSTELALTVASVALVTFQWTQKRTTKQSQLVASCS